ncbi:predicted protein [Uncinocarpus reesii 1704]|uniref:Uncharacterized protein n=1 Tax=Uncinocarpus reesii (strain UAMH 1704) TaxID=336963 RepID=C4JR84_UNCRE|nr:uncharacterized protein UREG_03566 [Uncinocarpus reesii 1704]EEP78720.1 predicted protein [Uncinocarpus reesii 1704]
MGIVGSLLAAGIQSAALETERCFGIADGVIVPTIPCQSALSNPEKLLDAGSFKHQTQKLVRRPEPAVQSCAAGMHEIRAHRLQPGVQSSRGKPICTLQSTSTRMTKGKRTSGVQGSIRFNGAAASTDSVEARDPTNGFSGRVWLESL